MLDQIQWTATAVYLLDLSIRIGLSVRVIKRRLPVGVALAWLSVILILPLAADAGGGSAGGGLPEALPAALFHRRRGRQCVHIGR
jgi:hypothetical protein